MKRSLSAFLLLVAVGLGAAFAASAVFGTYAAAQDTNSNSSSSNNKQ
ncbi:MAG TPA: hypothetical protein VNV38_06075 [Stellaceae bacterium]|jgi:hypothetical protein|nr:hypothetical protein [Stellaceae bacterium]